MVICSAPLMCPRQSGDRVMRKPVVTTLLLFGVLVLAQGCATPQTKVVQDSTPSWMKYETTGTRIRRPVGPTGHPDSATLVTRTTPRGLLLLPGVFVTR